jgi:hypothetical protein
MLSLAPMTKLSSALALAILFLGLLSAACSDDDDEKNGTSNGAVFSCISGPSTDGCFEISGLTGQALDALRDGCAQAGGTPGSGCPREGLSGICTSTAGGASSRRYYYGFSPDRIDAAKESCEQGTPPGVWSTS